MDAPRDQSPPPPPEPPPRARGRLTWLLWVFAMVFVVYPLSSGPVAKLESMGFFPSRVCPTFYNPLFYVADAMGLTGALDWYIWDLWNVRGSYPEVLAPPLGPNDGQYRR
ncbi:MAG TPA: hypothetical protein VJA21_06825 [Verrucomicrobiae bacterium]